MLSCFASACNSHQESAPSFPTKNTTVAAPADTLAERIAADFDRYIRQTGQSSPLPGMAVALLKDSSVILLKGYGWRNAGEKQPVTTNTVFRIGSLSKGFTGILCGILVEKGILHWQDKVKQLVPEFALKDPQQTQRIELRHLLSHTTGLPYHAYTNLIEEGLSLQTIVTDYFPKAKICGKEGCFYAYQNAAFSVTGDMMQAATGRPFPQLLHQYILQPAGMRHTSATFEAMNAETDKAQPHVWTGNSWQPQAISPAYYNTAEAGGINASIADMAQWLKILMGYRPDIITPHTLNDVFTPVIKTGNERRIQGSWISRDSASYALGWRILEHNGDTIVYHGGYVDGFRGEIAFSRRHNIGICMLFNGDTPATRDGIHYFFDLWERHTLSRSNKN